MAYPYKVNGAYFPGGEVLKRQETITLSGTAALGIKTVNVPPGDYAIDIIATGVAAVSGVDVKVYAYQDRAQTAALAQLLQIQAVGSETSVTLISQATSATIAPISTFRVQKSISNATFQGHPYLQLHHGMYISLLVSSVTTTTGDASLDIMMSPKV